MKLHTDFQKSFRPKNICRWNVFVRMSSAACMSSSASHLHLLCFRPMSDCYSAVWRLFFM